MKEDKKCDHKGMWVYGRGLWYCPKCGLIPEGTKGTPITTITTSEPWHVED